MWKDVAKVVINFDTASKNLKKCSKKVDFCQEQ